MPCQWQDAGTAFGDPSTSLSYIPHEPAIPLLGIHPREISTLGQMVFVLWFVVVWT